MEVPTQSNPFNLLTDEILLHILSFFVSDTLKSSRNSNRRQAGDGGDDRTPVQQQSSVLIDEKAIRTVMIVSKKWKRLAYSKELWKIPCGIEKGQAAYGNSVLLVDIAFRELSYLGFQKLYQYDCEVDGQCSYRVRERATGAEFDLIIATLATDENERPNYPLSRNQLKQYFAGHFVYAEKFMNPYRQGRQLHVPFRVHTGVHLMQQRGSNFRPVCRFVQIYWANTSIQPTVWSTDLCNERSQLYLLARNISQLTDMASALEENTWKWRVRHLLQLETSLEPFDPSRLHIQPEHW